MRKLLFCAVAGLSCSGCASVQDWHYELTNKWRAHWAWTGTDYDKHAPFASDFACGWRRGYFDASMGSCGRAPIVPPKEYWSACYQNPKGAAAIHAWYQGYQDGVVAAEQAGYGQFHTLPAMGPIVGLPPIDYPGSMDPGQPVPLPATEGFPAAPLENNSLNPAEGLPTPPAEGVPTPPAAITPLPPLQPALPLAPKPLAPAPTPAAPKPASPAPAQPAPVQTVPTPLRPTSAAPAQPTSAPTAGSRLTQRPLSPPGGEPNVNDIPIPQADSGAELAQPQVRTALLKSARLQAPASPSLQDAPLPAEPKLADSSVAAPAATRVTKARAAAPPVSSARSPIVLTPEPDFGTNYGASKPVNGPMPTPPAAPEPTLPPAAPPIPRAGKLSESNTAKDGYRQPIANAPFVAAVDNRAARPADAEPEPDCAARVALRPEPPALEGAAPAADRLALSPPGPPLPDVSTLVAAPAAKPAAAPASRKPQNPFIATLQSMMSVGTGRTNQ